MRRTFGMVLPLCLGVLLLSGWMILVSPGESAVAYSAGESREILNENNQTMESSDVISAALDYIKTQQKPDGGIAGFGLESNPDSTARAVLALAAAGRPMSWMTSISGTTMVEYLATQAIIYTHDITGTLFPGRAGILLAAVSAANEDPTDFGGMDIVNELTATLDLVTGAYSTTASSGWSTGEASDLSQAWAILGLSSVSIPVPGIASDYLVGTQAMDGSWGFGDLDTTALAVNALLGSGNIMPDETTIQNALDYFQTTQLPNGGWRPVWDTDPLNADSTGWIIQALRTAGFTNPSISWLSDQDDPISALISLQKPDGSIGGTYANAYSTVEAIYGLTEETLFNLGHGPRGLRALTWLNSLQNPDGSWSSSSEITDTGVTADAVLAYLSAGYDAYSISQDGNISAMDFLSNTAAAYVNLGPDAAGKLALTVQAAGADPREFGGIDIIQAITATYVLTNNGYGVVTDTWHQAYAILGLLAAGEEPQIDALATLRNLQQADGGWSHNGEDSESDPESTALAMQALIAAGDQPQNQHILEAIEFLHGRQDGYGGWDNARSTAFAIQGLFSAGIDLSGDDWLKDLHSPFNALEAYQKIDGPFSLDRELPRLDDADATRLAIPALLGINYPFVPGSLVDFDPILPGADPDRAVISLPRSDWGNSVWITLPIGSDFNQNLDLMLDWRVRGTEEWITGTLIQRGPGYLSATLPIVDLQTYELLLNYADPDGVQYGATLSNTLTLELLVEPRRILLPLVSR